MAEGRVLEGFDDDEDGSPDFELDVSTNQTKGTGSVMVNFSGGGMTLDNDWGDDDDGGSLELDMPPPSNRGSLSPHEPPPSTRGLPPPNQEPTPASVRGTSLAPASTRSPSLAEAPPPSSRGTSLAPAPSPAPHSSRRPDLAAAAEAAPISSPAPLSASELAAARIARFPEAPTQLQHMPLYAAKVVIRKVQLWMDLEALRRKRSHDVGLYETALRMHDKRAFRIGLAIIGAVIFVLAAISLYPVIAYFVDLASDD